MPPLNRSLGRRATTGPFLLFFPPARDDGRCVRRRTCTLHAAGEHGTLRVSIYRPATAASAATARTRELKSGVMRGVASFGYHGSREPLPLAARARHWMDLIARSRWVLARSGNSLRAPPSSNGSLRITHRELTGARALPTNYAPLYGYSAHLRNVALLSFV